MIESRTCSIQSHCKNAFQTMFELRQGGFLCDVILCVEGRKFPSHKIVLAGSSPYLKAMFTNGMLETDQDVVEIRDIDALTMQNLLDFMYTSTIEITINNVQSILQGASLFGLHQLRMLSAQFLQLQLTASNCLGIQYFADVYMCSELESAARQFVFQNFLEVVHNEEFHQLSEERLIDLLRSDKLQVMTESQVFDAAYSWLKYDPKLRTESACNILKHIKLGLLELPMLENVVIKSDFFRTCHKCQSLISSAIRCQYERKNMELLTPRAHPPCIYVVGGRNSQDCQLKSMERYDFLSDTWSSMTMFELRQGGFLCDVILCVEGRKFPSHKIVLAGSSPYLKAMFTNGMLETDQDVVEIRDIDALTMQNLLDFMYTSTIEITINNVQSILQGASLFGLHQLRMLSAQFLQLQLTASNCLGIQYFADVYMCSELESAARQFVFQNFLEVVHNEEFHQLSEERLIDLLRSDKLQVMTESQVFDAAYSWLKYDPKLRTESACNILKHIKLGLLELPMLENVVIKSDFFRTCHKCQSLISSAIRCQYERKNMELLTPRAHPPCIYVVGGRNSQDCQLKSMERYDFLSDTWSSMPGMNIARTAIGSATLEGMLYTVGGECALIDTQENTLYLRCMECYDPVQRQWIPKPEMKIARSFVAVAAIHGVLYAIGGEDRACGYNIVEMYDPKKEQWTFASSMKRRRAGAGITVCEGKIYVAGGYDRTLHMDRASMECYDPGSEEWTFMSEMEKARSGLTMATIDQNIFAFGGRYRHTDQYYDLVERFNVLTRQWTTLTPMNTPRAWPGVAIFDGKIFICGGFDGGYRLRSAESYDVESDRWTFISNMLVSRAGCGAAVV